MLALWLVLLRHVKDVVGADVDIGGITASIADLGFCM